MRQYVHDDTEHICLFHMVLRFTRSVQRGEVYGDVRRQGMCTHQNKVLPLAASHVGSSEACF